MRRATSTVLTTALLTLLAGCDFQKSGPSGPQVSENAIQVGDVAADFTLTDQHGLPRRLSDYRGHVILLDISTMWCTYCQIEADHAEEFYQQYKDRGFILLNALYADYNGAPITNDDCKEWADFYEISFPILADIDEEVWGMYGESNEIPLNIVIDRDFIVRYKAPGYNDTSIRQIVESLL
jgi:peroxiredoxin